MPREKIPAPRCANCDCYLYFSERIPKKQHGVMMHAGERFCLGCKKARRFRRSDPRVYVPSWCPKRKAPCELRVYGFKNRNADDMHYSLSLSLGYPILPQASRYAVIYDLTTELTPKEFWEGCYHHQSDAHLVGAAVHQYQVVEVDDGIQSVCFYKVDGVYQIVHGFDAAQARKNKRENY